MRRRSDLYFVIGIVCYVFPAFAVVFKQEAGWVESNVHNPAFDVFNIVPFSHVAAFTDRYLPVFYIMAVPTLWSFLASFNQLDLKPFFKTFLQFLATLCVFFVIPTLTWPIGNTYYETLDFYMGQLSLVGMFFLLFLYMHWRPKV
jgi:hypothetical protein